MSKITTSRSASFIILAIIYLAATLIGFFTYKVANYFLQDSYWSLFISDVIATIYVWAYGLYYKNVSVYDPYWSVLPPVMLSIWAIACGSISVPGILLMIAVWYWGIRLTGNWAYTFRNLDSEDWRYTKYRTEQNAFIFQVINFFGLNMMPTIVVFIALLPGIELIRQGGSANPFTFIGFAISIAAATIQLIADNQRHRFAKEHKGEICRVGLWKHGRHPNYFGEITMWWGVWIMYVSVHHFAAHPWYVVGPLAMTGLFLGISIPLMEGRQLKNKPGYAEYKKETRILI